MAGPRVPAPSCTDTRDTIAGGSGLGTSSTTGRKFRGVSFCDNIGLVTAFVNDVAFEELFAGQLTAILEPGDLVIAVSRSGNSPNFVKAVECVHGAGADALAVVGYGVAESHHRFKVTNHE